MIIGEAFDYLKLIDYQQDAAVSRTIIDRPIGTVTVFAFDKGQGLSEHTAPYDALVHIIDGTAKITIEGCEHQLAAPNAIIMPANHPHALCALTPFKMVLAMIREKVDNIQTASKTSTRT